MTIAIPKDDATLLYDHAKYVHKNNPKKLAELERFYLAFCAALNQAAEVRPWPFRVQ